MPGPVKPMRLQKPQHLRQTLAKLSSYLRRYRMLLILAFLMVFVNIAASLAGTSYLQPIIDNFLAPVKGNPTVAERLSGLARGAAVLLGIYILSCAAAYAQSRLMVYIAQHTIHDVRRDLFQHLQGLPVRYFDTRTHGEMMSRFTNDVDTLNDALQNGLTTLFSSVITIVGILALMLYRSIPLTLLTLCFTPILIFAVTTVMKRSSKYFAAQQKNLGAVNGYIEEMMTGAKVVKVFGYEERSSAQFCVLNRALQESATAAQRYAGMMMPLSRNINSINFALIAAVGGVLSAFGYLSVGGLVVFLQLVQQFSRPLTEASNQYNAVVTAIAGAERIFEVIEETPEQTNDTPEYTLTERDGAWYWASARNEVPVHGDVKFDHVTFGYIPGKIVLHDISLYAKPGQKIAFVGSTGAGKTTVTNLLTRFYDVNEGTIIIDGIPLQKIARESLRRAISVVLQDTHLFTGTIMDNIRYGRLTASDDEVIAAAKLASAHSFIMRLPQGYETVIEGDGANLSQGQRQLLNIARAALANAPILILDEATSSVDTRTERHIEHGLDRLMKNRTTFIIAHRLSTVRESDAILVMEQGRIEERGTHDDLLALRGRYYQLYTGKLELD